MNMKWKILIPMASIMVALVITTTVFSTNRFTGYTGILFNERISVAANGLKKFISDCEKNTRIAALTASSTRNIVNAVRNQDREEIIRLLSTSLDLYHVDFFTVTDGDGTVLARTHEPDRYGDSVLGQKNIREALKDNIETCTEEGTEVKLSTRTGAPVHDTDGTIIGVISAGIRFDTNDTLDMLKDHYQADFSVIHSGDRIATTIFVNGERITETPLDPEMIELIYSSKEEFFGDVTIYNENYSAFYKPFLDENNDIFAIIFTGCPNTKLNAAKYQMQSSIIAIGLFGLIISMVILNFITAKIVLPVNRLKNLVSKVTGGNMDVDIDREGVGRDEIGLLTLDIYSLVNVIKLILSDLSRLTVNLDKFGTYDLRINTDRYSGSYREIIDGIKKLADSISTMRKTMAIMDHLDTMISVTDFEYNLLYVNRNMAQTYGMDRENYIGKKCYNVIRNLDRPCEICQMKNLLPEKEKYPFNDYDSLYDATTGKYIGGRAAIIRWVDGEQVFFNSIKDETIKTKYQEQLLSATSAAEAASVAKTAFLANMSHEIRTPMNSIIGFTELAMDSDITPIAREYMKLIKENAEGLLQIINAILDISKIESGNVQLEFIPFELRDLLKTCKNLIMPRAVEKNLSLQFYAESSIQKKLVGDPTKLRQVLLNLLSNAVKFTNSGGVKLSVTVKNETEEKITLRFEIKDTGIGMTPGQISKIFEPFMQGDISTTRKYGGTGLGMTITKNILDLMGSKLKIESEPGVGTVIGFELSFDLISIINLYDETAESEKITVKIEKPLFMGKVLVCEDNLMNQKVITENLGKVGLSAEIAENGKVGIEKVQSNIENGDKPFDLIFMDINMPVMDGLEAAPKIIALGTGTPIVAMTANIMTDDRELYTGAGMIDYISKPFSSQELWSCLLKYITPVSFEKSKNHGTDNDEESEQKFQIELMIDFIKGNQSKYEDIINALKTGDLKTAHRLAHTLKSNAALIGKTELQKISAGVETSLTGGENLVTETQLADLNTELSAVLKDLEQYRQKEPENIQQETGSAGYDAEKSYKLLENLEPFLKSGNPECLEMIGEIRLIPGSGELIQQMEDFYFKEAAKTLEELKNNLMKP